MVSIRRFASNWRAYVACWGLVLALSASPSWSDEPAIRLGPIQNQQQDEPYSYHQETGKSLYGTNGNALPAETGSSTQSQDKTGNDQNEGAGKSSSDWWIVRLTALSFLIACIQTVVFWLQAKRLRETKMDQVSQEASRIGQAQVRAYVSFVDAKITMKKIASEISGIYIAPFFTIQMKNFGNSPAIRYRFYTTAAFIGVEDISLRSGRARDYAFGDRDIAASEVIGYEDFPIAYATLTGNDIYWFERKTVSIVTTFHTVFTNVFGAEVYGSTSFFASFTIGDIFDEVQARPISKNAESMAEELIKMKNREKGS